MLTVPTVINVKTGFVSLILVRGMRTVHQVLSARMVNANQYHLVKLMLIVSIVRSVKLEYVLVYVRLTMIAQRNISVIVHRK